MTVKKQKTPTYAQLEKVLTLAGLLLIAVGCIANLYSASVNLRFIHDPIDCIYYFRYILLLAGGFAAGYLCTKKAAASTRYNQLLVGVVYATLAIALYWLFDLARFGLQNVFTPSYPWGKLVFMGTPLLSVITTLFIAYISQRKAVTPTVSTSAKGVLILSFVVYEVYVLMRGTYFLTANSTTPSWLIAGSYALTPLAITAISYFVLNTIQKQHDRLFYASLIGVFYGIFAFILWEFQTDPSEGAVSSFGAIVTALTLLFTGALLLLARRATR